MYNKNKTHHRRSDHRRSDSQIFDDQLFLFLYAKHLKEKKWWNLALIIAFSNWLKWLFFRIVGMDFGIFTVTKTKKLLQVLLSLPFFIHSTFSSGFPPDHATVSFLFWTVKLSQLRNSLRYGFRSKVLFHNLLHRAFQFRSNFLHWILFLVKEFTCDAKVSCFIIVKIWVFRKVLRY